MVKEDKNSLINIPNRYFDEDNGPIFYIKFLEGVDVDICGGLLAGGARLCMSPEEE